MRASPKNAHLELQTKRRRRFSPIQPFFISSISKQINPQSPKATQNKLSKILTRQWKKKIYPFRPFFFFNQQTILPPKSKSTPKQAFQNAFATLLLLSHKKNSAHFPQTSKSHDKSSTILRSKLFNFNSPSHSTNTPKKTNKSIKPIQKILSYIPLKLIAEINTCLETIEKRFVKP